MKSAQKVACLFRYVERIHFASARILVLHEIQHFCCLVYHFFQNCFKIFIFPLKLVHIKLLEVNLPLFENLKLREDSKSDETAFGLPYCAYKRIAESCMNNNIPHRGACSSFQVGKDFF